MAFNKEIYKDYEETLQTIVKELLANPSPSGYGQEVSQYILDLLNTWGVEANRTIKGGVVAHIKADPQKAEENTEGGLLLQAVFLLTLLYSPWKFVVHSLRRIHHRRNHNLHRCS